MFSTDLSTFLAIFGAFNLMCASILLYIVRKLVIRTNAAIHYLHNQNKNAVSLRRLAELEATLTELSDSYETLLRSVKKLGARARTRAARANGQDAAELPATVPAGESERAEYKSKLRDRLRKEGRL